MVVVVAMVMFEYDGDFESKLQVDLSLSRSKGDFRVNRHVKLDDQKLTAATS